MATDLSVINAAATRTGNNPISQLTAGQGIVGDIALQNYENMVKAALAEYPWKRATKIAQIERLDAAEQGDPPEPWTAAYQLPNDLLEIRTVKVAGSGIDYAVHGDKILCDAPEGVEVILHYIWRPDEAQWPPWFREGMIRRCEAMFLRAIGERYREAEARDEAAEKQFARAKSRDAQAETPRDPAPSPTLAARGSSSPTTRTSTPR